METSTEGVAEAATDDPTAAGATAAARPGTAEEPDAAGAGTAPTAVTAGQEGGDTSVDGPRAAEAEPAAQPGTAEESDAADVRTTSTADPAGQQDDVDTAIDQPQAAEAALAARPRTAEEVDAADVRTTSTAVAAGQENGDTAIDGPRAAEAELAAQPGTAEEPDATDVQTTSTAIPAGQQDLDTAIDRPQAAEGALAAQPETAEESDATDAGAAPTAIAVGYGGGDAVDAPGATEALLPERSGTAEGSDTADARTAPTVIAVGQEDGDTAMELPRVPGAAEEPGVTGAQTTVTAIPAGQQDRGVVVSDPQAVGPEIASAGVEAGAVPSAGGGARAAGGAPAAPASLSPSRANDFMQCPLLYRFRVIDRLPEKPSAAATRGTLVHSVLERLFDAPAGERTAPAAKSLIPGQWDRLRESRPEVLELFADDPDGERLATWLAEAERLVERWFTLEDPTRLEPAERELFVEAELDSGLRLRGIIDRVDVAPTGEVRIVDYKTGKAPRPEYAEGALFQMKFYALVVWRLKNVIPRRLQLVYLGSGDVLTYDPVLADLERVERKLLALWEAIRQATESGNWRPRPTKLCGWCDHQEHCPEFGGTPPPYPLPVKSATGEQGRMGPD